PTSRSGSGSHPGTSCRWSGRSGVPGTARAGSDSRAQALSRDERQGGARSAGEGVVSGSTASWALRTRTSSSSSDRRRSVCGSVAGRAARYSINARIVGFTPIRQAMAAVRSRVEAPMNMAARTGAKSEGSKGMPGTTPVPARDFTPGARSEVVCGGKKDEGSVLLRLGPGQEREVEGLGSHIRPLAPPAGEAHVGADVLGLESAGERESVVVHVRGVVHVGPLRIARGEVGEETGPHREPSSQGELGTERHVQHRLADDEV